jgi:hypothetical protein
VGRDDNSRQLTAGDQLVVGSDDAILIHAHPQVVKGQHKSIYLIILALAMYVRMIDQFKLHGQAGGRSVGAGKAAIQPIFYSTDQVGCDALLDAGGCSAAKTRRAGGGGMKPSR